MTIEHCTQRQIIPSISSLEALDWSFADSDTGGLTHGIHPYPAKYIPQIPRALIAELSRPGEIVADIFCGSGTTLVEAMASGRNAVGIDANPLACLVSEAKTTRLQASDNDRLAELVRRAREQANSLSVYGEGLFRHHAPFVSQAQRPEHKAISFWFEPFAIEELAEILSWCRQLPTETSRKVALAAFSAIVVAVSRQDSDTRYVRRDKKLRPGDVFRRFSRSLSNATRAVELFCRQVPSGVSCQVHHASVLSRPDIGYADLIVCSPPYPNAYSYHLYHMTRMLWLGMDQPRFKQEEIGSHRKYSSKGRNRATVATFKREMDSTFDWLRHHLRIGRYACFVVGDSKIRGDEVNNADLICASAATSGFQEVARFRRRMLDTRKAFNPVIGRIKTEHVLILQRQG